MKHEFFVAYDELPKKIYHGLTVHKSKKKDDWNAICRITFPSDRILFNFFIKNKMNDKAIKIITNI
jgi:hypothetical protein